MTALGMFTTAVSATMMATGIGVLASGLSDAVVDPLTHSVLGKGDGVLYKLVHAVLAASVITIMAWLVVSGGKANAWRDVWTHITPTDSAAMVPVIATVT